MLRTKRGCNRTRFSLLLAVALTVPGAAENTPRDALTLLSDASKTYAEAASYHIEAVEERAFSNKLERNWQKTFLTAIVAPNGRYRYEGRSASGWATLVSDGKTNWDYHANEHLYTQTAASSSDPGKSHIIPMEEISVLEAKHLAMDIRKLPNRLKSAMLLSDEKIELNGREIDCHVVRFTNGDLKFPKPHIKIEETVWIDKSRNVIVKTHQQRDFSASAASDTQISEETIIYRIVELDEEEPERSFTFSPPAEAKLVDSFPEPRSYDPDVRAAEFLGKQAPEIRLKAADGTPTSLSAFRGKPIFLEFWATWCEPCIDLVPELKKLHAETTAKGLLWISIDNDEDPSAVATFVSQEHISWPNYHDEDGSLGKAFSREGIPLAVLIDANGRITFYKAGYEITELRAALAKLGPEFSASTPAPSSK